MFNFDKPLPSYLNEKKNIVRLILFTSVFALVFINIYSPFGSDRWYTLTKLQFFTFSSLSILTGVLVVVISRIFMYGYCKRRLLLVWQYILWIFAEILLMAVFYVLFEKLVLGDVRSFSELMEKSVRNTSLVLLLPYSISWLYLSWQDKKELIERMAESQDSSTGQREMIPFYDEKGILKFSIKRDDLLYLESAENYVNICYINKDKVAKYMVRDTLKKIEESFAGTGLVRCHRCFIVNFDKVRVIRRDKDGLRLELDAPAATDIPVSRTYIGNVMATFSKYCQPGEMN